MPAAGRPLFTLEALEAAQGDALLLHHGTTGAPGLVWIDGGPAGIYPTNLKKRLQQLRAASDGGKQPLAVDLLLVSHVDDDHIHGVIDAFEDLSSVDDERRRPLAIRQLWHNSFAGNELVAA